jgi:hypothetical protein
MQFPLEIAFETVARTQLEKCIRSEARQLEAFAPLIASARVVVGRPRCRNHVVDAYRVEIRIARSGAADLVVTRDPAMTGIEEDVYATIRDAFKALRRRLSELNPPTSAARSQELDG